MPGTHFTFTTLWGKEYHYPPFSGEDTEAQSGCCLCKAHNAGEGWNQDWNKPDALAYSLLCLDIRALSLVDSGSEGASDLGSLFFPWFRRKQFNFGSFERDRNPFETCFKGRREGGLFLGSQAGRQGRTGASWNQGPRAARLVALSLESLLIPGC